MSEFQRLHARPRLVRSPVVAPIHGADTAHGGAVSAGAGHDFSRISLYPRQSVEQAGVGRRVLSQTRQPSPGVETARGISSAGAGTVTTSYVPEAGDTSTKIVFIQVMHESVDGVPAKPGSITPGSSYLDADTTAEFYHVDYTPGEKDPYYNGDDPNDFGPQGNAVSNPKLNASTHDSPNLGDASVPAGGTTVNWDFRTAAFSAAGADAGTYYGYSDWGYEKTKGVAGKTSTKGAHTRAPGSKFDSAVKLFNSNRGFMMPGAGGASLLGGIVGGVLGGVLGGLLGFAVGGIPGAIIGGVAGAAVGGGVGAFI